MAFDSKQEWFDPRPNVGASHLAALNHITKHADAKLELVDNTYWIDGRSLGVAECSDRDSTRPTTLKVCVIQLDNVASVAIEVWIRRSNQPDEWAAGSWASGRSLTLRCPDGEIKIPYPSGNVQSANTDIETFIDQVLAALAGRDFATDQ